MSYQKTWVSFKHKSLRMMTLCRREYLSQITVEPVLFLYMLSTFSQYALFQDLVYSKVCWSQYSPDICQHLHNEEYKSELENVQRLSSHWILMSTISLVLPSLLIAMYLGSWSDKFGRKWPVVFPPLGGICACMVYIIISVVEDASVAWICLASLLSGLTGGFVACISSCMTYVASVTTPENRTIRISRLEAMTFLGGTVGPFISGSMLEVTGHAYAFFYMMLCYTFAFLYAVIFVRDTRKDGMLMEGGGGSSAAGSRSSSAPPQMEGEGGKRTRNKSSDTIPSSVVATTMSTSSGGEDIEQKEGLLSASDLHVAAIGSSEDTSVEITTRIEQHPVIIHQHDDDNHEEAAIGMPTISQIAHHHDNDDPMMIAVVSHHHNHHNDNNRNSMGSSSGRNSSLHGHDDGSSSAASDDDQRNIIRRSRHSSALAEDEEQKGGCCTKYFSMAHMSSAVMTVLKKREGGKRSLLMLSLMAGFMFMVITAGEMDVAYLFARAEPLKWSYQMYSYYFGFKYGFGAFVLLVATPCMQKLGVEDSTMAVVGMISRMASLVVYGLSVNTYMAFSVPAFAVFSVFTIPATRSLLSKLVNPDEQGKMFAFVAMMEDLCTLSASLIFNSIYPVTRSILQGLIFLLAASTLVIPIGIMCYVRWRMAAIRQKENSSRVSKAHLHSVERTDPAALLCLPKDYELGK